MEKKLLPLLLLVFFLCQLPSCKKFDYKDPARHCSIQSVTESFYGDDKGHRTVYYNNDGNPTSVEYLPEETGTGKSPFIFYYDSKGRLIGYDGYQNHHYTYNSKSQIIIDSVVYNYAGQDERYAERIFYDYWGRIIKVISKFYYSGARPDSDELGKSITTYYKYNSKGNLIRDDATGYDNKVSIYRSHPLWMFIHKNYSVNNALPGPLTYNSAGLPVTYGPDAVIDNFLDKELVDDIFVYDCAEQDHK